MPVNRELAVTERASGRGWHQFSMPGDTSYWVNRDVMSASSMRGAHRAEAGGGPVRWSIQAAHGTGRYAEGQRQRGLPVLLVLSTLPHTFEMAVYSSRVHPLIELGC